MNEDASNLNRRRFLQHTASVTALGAAALVFPTAHAEEVKVPDDPMRVPGAFPRPYGARSPFRAADPSGRSRARSAFSSFGEPIPRTITTRSPLCRVLHGIVTPSSLHFERHHNGVPAIDRARHRLLIHGLVDRPLIFTLGDLERFPPSHGSLSGMFREYMGLLVREAQDFPSKNLWLDEHQRVDRRQTVDPPGGGRLFTGSANWMLAEGSDAAGLDRSVPLDRRGLDRRR